MRVLKLNILIKFLLIALLTLCVGEGQYGYGQSVTLNINPTSVCQGQSATITADTSLFASNGVSGPFFITWGIGYIGNNGNAVFDSVLLDSVPLSSNFSTAVVPPYSTTTYIAQVHGFFNGLPVLIPADADIQLASFVADVLEVEADPDFTKCFAGLSDPLFFEIEVLVNDLSGGTVRLDWGDGTIPDAVTQNFEEFLFDHTYSTYGDFPITIEYDNNNGCTFILDTLQIVTGVDIAPSWNQFSSIANVCVPIDFEFEIEEFQTNNNGDTVSGWSFHSPNTTYTIFLASDTTSGLIDIFTVDTTQPPNSQVQFYGDSVTFTYPPPDSILIALTEPSCGFVNGSYQFGFRAENNACQADEPTTGTITTMTALESQFVIDSIPVDSMVDDTIGCVGQCFELRASSIGSFTSGGSTNTYACDSSVEYKWEFRGVNVDSFFNPNNGNFAGVNNPGRCGGGPLRGEVRTFRDRDSVITIVFNQPGFYQVRLLSQYDGATIDTSYDNGCSEHATEWKTICITEEPDARFVPNRREGCQPLRVRFNNTSTPSFDCNDSTTSRWTVDFFDPDTACVADSSIGVPYQFVNNTDSTSENPRIRFIDPGRFSIRLIQENFCGIDTAYDTITVFAGVTGALATIEDICQGDCIDPSVNVPSSCFDTTEYLWTIQTGYGSGPGGFSYFTTTDSIPGQFCYPDSGIFTIELALSNACDTTPVTRTFRVKDTPPAPEIIADTVCEDDPFELAVENYGYYTDPPFPMNASDTFVFNWTSAADSSFQTSDSLWTDSVSVLADDGYWSMYVTLQGCDGPSDSGRVIINPLPTAIFDSLPSACPPGDSIRLTNSSILASTYLWTVTGGNGVDVAYFNDSSLRRPWLFIPDNQSPNDVSYTVTLTVFSDSLCVDDTSHTFTIFGRPEASFIIDTALCGPDTIVPQNTSQYADSGYFWTVIGQNAGVSPADSITPNIFFPENNTTDSILYPIRLNAYTVEGCVDSAFDTVTVYPQPLVEFSGLANSCSPITIVFDNLSDPFNGEDTSTMNFTWTLEGSGIVSQNSSFTGTFPNTGTSDLSYVVTLEGTTQHGCTETFTDSITVFPDAVAEFFANDTIDCAPFVISSQIIDNVTDYQGANGSYTWYLNDFANELGSSTSPIFPGSVTINNPSDTFLIILVVGSDDGCIPDTAFQEFLTHPNPIADFGVAPDSGCHVLLIQVSDSASILPSDAPLSWQYIIENIGLANGTDTLNAVPSPLLSLTNTSNDEDSAYSITQIVTSVNNCSSSSTDTVVVHPVPLASFVLDSLDLCADSPLSVTGLTNNSVVDVVESWLWTVDNGGVLDNDTAFEPTLSFPDNQSGVDTTYTIELFVESQYGCIDDTLATIDVYTRPIAEFSMDSVVCGPDSVLVVNNSSYDTGWSWSVSDATVLISDASAETPVFVFPANTTQDSINYVVELVSFSAEGCSDTTSQVVTVYPQPLVSYTGVTDSCDTLTISFSNTSDPYNGEDTSTMSFVWTVTGPMGVDTISGNGLTYSFINDTLTDVSYVIGLEGITQHGCVEEYVDSLVIYPDPLAEFVLGDTINCAPFVIDDSVITGVSYLEANDDYTWYIDASGTGSSYVQVGTGVDFPITDTIVNDNDSILVRLIVTNVHGCNPDTLDQLFITIEDPEAGFVLDVDSGCHVLTVNATDTSSPVNSYNWYVDTLNSSGTIDSMSSALYTTQNAQFTLTNPTNDTDVSYIIRFEAIAGSGCSSSSTDTVVVHPVPLASFVLDSLDLCADSPLSVTGLTNNSVVDVVESWLWTVDNGGVLDNDTAFEPTLSFPDNQSGVDTTYTIELFVESQYGCIDDTLATIDVYTRPIAEFSMDSVVCGPDSVLVVNNSSYDTGWSWSVSDATVLISDASAETPVFVFPANTTQDSINYVVELVSFSAEGCSDTTSQVVTVYPQPLVSYTGVTDSCDTLTISFSNTSDPYNGEDTSTMSFVWTVTGPMGVDTISGNGLTYSFINDTLTDVSYVIGLEGITQHGCVEEYVDSLVIYPDPLAEFVLGDTINCAPFVIDDSVITGVSYLEANDDYTWYIDASGTGSSYVQVGTGVDFPITDTIVNDNDSILVRLIVTNVHGCNPDTLDQLFITIEDPEAGFVLDVDSGCHVLTVNATDTSSPVNSYNWYVDTLNSSGTIDSMSSALYTTQNAQFTLTNPTNDTDVSYIIRFEAIAGSGCSSSSTDTVVVHPVPLASFVLDSLDLCADSPLSVTGLTNNSVVDVVESWLWTVDNGGVLDNDTAFEPTLSFPDNQSGVDTTYTIELFVESQYGCIDDTLATIDVYTRPIAEFSMDSVVCGPDSVLVVNNSSYDTGWSWSVSDATVLISDASAETPVFVFPANTTQDSINYVVELVSFSAEGCSDTTSQVVTVYPQPLVSYTGVTDSCDTLTISFSNTSDPYNGEDTSTMSFVWTVTGPMGVDTISGNGLTYSFINDTLTDVSYVIGLEGITQHGCVEEYVDSLVIYPDPLAEFVLGDTINCAPFVIDDSVITGVSYLEANDDYTWYIDASGTGSSYVQVGTGVDFPITDTIVNDNDSILVRLIVTNVHGCNPDTLDQLFITIEDPEAGFVLDVDSGCHVLTVNATDTSSPVNSYNWYVDTLNSSGTIDSMSSALYTTQNAQFTLTNTLNDADSIYVIRLEVIAGTGCGDITTDTVVVHPVPLASFVLDSLDLCADSPLSVTGLTNNSVVDVVESWLWTVDNGGVLDNDTAFEPTLSFPDNQSGVDTTYTIELFVESQYGCIDDTLATIDVYTRPIAEFSMDSVVCGPDSVLVVNNSSYDTGWSWSVSDATVLISDASAETPVFVFPANTTQDSINYVVELVSFSAEGCSDTTSQVVTVYPQPLVSYTGVTDSCDTLTISFSNTSDPYNGEDTSTMSFVWTVTGPMGVDTISGNGLTYSFINDTLTDVSYVIGLEGITQHGCVEEYVDSLVIYPDPVAQVDVVTTLECAPFTIDASIINAIDFPDAVDSFAWYLDTSGTGSSFDSLVYSSTDSAFLDSIEIVNDDDSVTLRLITFNVHGCNPDTVDVRFVTIEDPVAGFTILDSLCSGSTYVVTDTSNPSTGLSYQWYVQGLGETLGSEDSSTVSDPSFTLLNNSNDIDTLYEVQLIVTAGTTGCTDVATDTVVVHPVPLASFVLDSLDLCADSPLSVTGLTNNSVVDVVESWLWTVDNGGVLDNDTAFEPTLSFPDNQSGVDTTYTIELFVESQYGCIDDTLATIDVYTRPIAEFSMDSVVCGPDSVLVVNNSSYDTGWSWSVSDATVLISDASAETPVFVFPANTTQDSINYVVELVSFSAEGCSDTTSQVVTVYPQPLVSYTGVTDSCDTLTISFSNTSDPYNGEDTSTMSFVWTVTGPMGVDTISGNGLTYSFINDTLTDVSYVIGLEGITQHGCVEEYVDSLVIYPDPVAQVDLVTTSDCAPFDIDSSVINAIDFPGAVDSFLWFIDTTGLGSTFDVTLSATASPSFPSTYTIAQENDSIAIRLVTLNVHGCIQDTVDTVFRTFDDPEADFTLDDTIGCHPLIVAATDASTPVSSWNWYIDVADTLGQTPTNFAQIVDTLQNPLPFRLNNTGAGIDSVYDIRLIVEVGVTGCKDTASRQVVVLPLPTVDAGPTLEACSNYDTINLNQQSGASPLPGFWSGNGVVQDSLFVPDDSLVNVSPGQSLDYIYIDSNGCADTSSTFMIIYPLPVINAGADTTVCNQDLPFVAIGVDSLTPAFVPPFGTPPGLPDTAYWTGPLSPYAGPFSATPDSGIIFLSNYPPDSTQPYLLQLTYTDPNRCTVVDTLEVTIIEPIQAFAGFPDSNCLDYGLDTIQGFTPSIGGTWSGPGIVNDSLGVIDTRLAGPGRHELIYSYGSQTCTTYDTIYYIVWPLPIASYTGDLFCEQNPVFFVDESTSDSAAIIDWTWTFGNGDLSFVQDPVYTYPSPGQFNVSLSVVDGNLCEDDTTRLITIHPLPDVLFTNDTAVCEGFELCMNIINPDVNTTYYWDYGDGTLDTTQGTELPCHTYGSGGFYSITLVAVNQFGCVDSSFSYVRVASLPLAEFVPSDSVGCGPLTVNSFNPSPQGAFGSYTYFWDFGGIDTSFDFIPGPFTFPPPLYNDTVYVIEFRVYSAACQAVDVAFANILVSPIPTTIVEADTTSFCSPYTVTFTNNTIGQPETFFIDWGDGSADTTGNPSWNTITHEFVNNTLYTVVYDVFITFQNSCGFSDTTISITVTPNTTVAEVALRSDSLCPGDSVFFESNAIGYGTVVYDFGDGSPLVSDTSAIVSHLYTQSDTFEVIQYVSDVNNCSSTSDTILVVVNPIPAADFDFSPTDYGCDGDTVLVTMINTSLLGEDYSWNLGNGSTSNDFEPSTTYQDSGSYPVELIVTSAFGCLDTALDTFTVYPNPIIYGIDVQPDSGCQPLTVTFQDSSYLGNVRVWDFGDGNTLVDSSAAGSPISHTYFFPGTYQVDLTVYNFGVCGDTLFDAASVIVFVAPEANFTYMINDIPIPNGGELFTDNLSTDAVAYNWDFGDNFTDTTFEPYHLYESGYGPYQIELEAISIDGCRDTFYASVEFPPFVPNLVFPNAFSPESGLGEAAIFLPHGIGLKEYRFEIYSTFGELIWYTDKLEETSPVEGWDGRDKNGVLLPQDKYVWRAYAKFLDGSTWRGQERDGTLSREGSLILIR